MWAQRNTFVAAKLAGLTSWLTEQTEILPTSVL